MIAIDETVTLCNRTESIAHVDNNIVQELIADVHNLT